ncbi:MAG: GNAT family N-acetyltransferase [Nitrococcus sp.]|nr:GNAT family N-acetyltransferase [Nitrococcus sp.]
MDVRPATCNDEAALYEIHRAVFRSHIEQIWGWNEEWQRSNFATELASSSALVILIDARIAGYVQFRNEGNRIYVQNIALLPDVQSKGIGTRLIKELQAKATVRGVPLELDVFRTNTSARRFYERLGFERMCDTEMHTQMSWSAINEALQPTALPAGAGKVPSAGFARSGGG